MAGARSSISKYFIGISALVAIIVVAALWVTGDKTVDQGADAANCEPNYRLEKPCRPWLGAAVGGYQQSASDINSQMNFFNKRLNNPGVLNNPSMSVTTTKKMDMAHVYHPQGSNLFSGSVRNVLNNAAIPQIFVNWKPLPNGFKWRDAGGNNATVNNYIKAGAQAVKGLGSRKIILSVWHEPENDISVGNCASNADGASMGSPADYVAMWRNVDKIFAEESVGNVIWAMNYMGFPKWNCLVPQLWPGNDIVDWVVYDQYASGTESFVQSVKPFYDYLAQNSNAQHDYLSKAWGLAEHGYGNASGNSTESGASLYWQQGKTAIQNNVLPRLKMWLVFDTSVNGNSQVGVYFNKTTVSIPEQTAFNGFADAILAKETSAAPTPPSPPPSAPIPAPVITSLAANPSSVAFNGTTTITWKTTNVVADGCNLSPSPLTSASANGQWTSPKLTASVTYTLTCKNGAGQTTSKNVSVVVANQPAPGAPPAQPSTSGGNTTPTVQATTGETIANAEVGGTITQGNLVTLEPSTVTDAEKIAAIKKVEYYNDETKKLIQTITEPPFAMDTNRLNPGTYTIMQRTYFDDGSVATKTQTLTIAPKDGVVQSPVWLMIRNVAIMTGLGGLAFVGRWIILHRLGAI